MRLIAAILLLPLLIPVAAFMGIAIGIEMLKGLFDDVRKEGKIDIFK